MDENFTPNATNNEPTPPQAPAQQPQTPPQYNAPYNAQSGAYNQPQTGYQQNNTSYTNAGYNAPNASPNNQQPFYTQSTPSVQFTKGRKKSKKNVGKIIFVALICICIVFSSMAIGNVLSGNDKFNMPSSNTATGDHVKNDGAQANVED